jgi:hypothetical protein
MFVTEAPAQSGDRELEDLPLERLEHEICELAAQLTARMALWLSLLGEFDRREAWGECSGCRSTADWVAWRCALSPRAAREHVRVARALPGLPRIRDAFESGQLSYSKVRVLTRVAEPDSEEDLLDLAGHATATQLERMLRAFRRVSRAEAHAAYENRYLTWYWDEDGSLCLRARLPAEEGALVLEALHESRDALFRERDGLERGPAGPSPDNGPAGPQGPPDPDRQREHPRPTNADAFSAMAEAALARGPTPLCGPERHQLTVEVDLDSLVHDDRGAVHVRDGPALAPETARRLVHEGGFSVRRTPAGELEFRRPDGRLIPVSPRLPPPRRRFVKPIPAGPLLTGTGERMDLALCVDAVYAATDRGG